MILCIWNNVQCPSFLYEQRFCFHFSIWNGLLRKFHTQIWISSFSWKTGKRSDNPGAETTALLEDHHLESRRCLFQAVFDTPALLPAWDWSRINLLYLQACASFLLTVKKKVKYFLYPWFYQKWENFDFVEGAWYFNRKMGENKIHLELRIILICLLCKTSLCRKNTAFKIIMKH